MLPLSPLSGKFSSNTANDVQIQDDEEWFSQFINLDDTTQHHTTQNYTSQQHSIQEQCRGFEMPRPEDTTSSGSICNRIPAQSIELATLDSFQPGTYTSLANFNGHFVGNVASEHPFPLSTVIDGSIILPHAMASIYGSPQTERASSSTGSSISPLDPAGQFASPEADSTMAQVPVVDVVTITKRPILRTNGPYSCFSCDCRFASTRSARLVACLV